jgi:hypothetical protein
MKQQLELHHVIVQVLESTKERCDLTVDSDRGNMQLSSTPRRTTNSKANIFSFIITVPPLLKPMHNCFLKLSTNRLKSSSQQLPTRNIQRQVSIMFTYINQ